MEASLNTLHHQDTDWLRELAFYKVEIGILTKRLEEIISKNADEDVRAGVEHLQNRFILLRERLDTLKHNIRVRERLVDQLVMEKPGHINHHTKTVSNHIQSDMKDFATSFADTRFELNEFAAMYL
jgi:hypothetical protein